MAEIRYSATFLKHVRLRVTSNPKLKKQFDQRLALFLTYPQSPILRDHALSGDKKGLRSFSITGDIRVIYFREDDLILFQDIGTHNQVY